jgi:hypothetical protein
MSSAINEIDMEFKEIKNDWLLEPWSFKNSSSCLLSFKIDVN